MTFRLLSAVVLAMAAAAPAVAQEPAAGRTRSVSTLDATVDLFGTIDRAFDASTGALPDGPSTLPLDRTRRSWGGNSSLIYTKRSNRLDATANFGASVRRFGVENDDILPGYTGSAFLSGPWGRRTEWTAGTSLSYGPVGAAGFLDPSAIDPTTPAIPLPDYGLSNQDQLVWSTTGTLKRNISRRGSLTGSLTYTRSNAVGSVIQGVDPDAPGTEDALDLTTRDEGWFQGWGATGRYTYQATRYLNWYAGYGLSQNDVTAGGTDAAPATARLHTIDLGVAYGRPLSFSRRTRISTQLGSSILRDRATRDQQWVATGNASVRHEIGRTWTAQLSYSRDTRFVPTFIDPIVNNGAGAKVSGNVTRRSALSLLANYSSGTVGIDTGSNGYTMRTASVSYRYAFLQRMATYVEYFVFDFDFDGGVQLVDPLISQSGRHGIRFGVSIGTGLLGNRRSGPAGIGEGGQ